MFISLLTNNLVAVNKHLSKGVSGNLFNAHGVLAVLSFEEGVYYLTVTSELDGGPKVIKLGKTSTISKSVLNQLEVWFHKEYRQVYNESIQIITASIKNVNIKPFILDIGWVKRLCFSSNMKEIKYGSPHLDELISTFVTVQRSVTNRLQVFVDIHTGGIRGALTKFVPTHVGIMRTYRANMTSDPVNKWLREALLEHVDINLK